MCDRRSSVESMTRSVNEFDGSIGRESGCPNTLVIAFKSRNIFRPGSRLNM